MQMKKVEQRGTWCHEENRGGEARFGWCVHEPSRERLEYVARHIACVDRCWQSAISARRLGSDLSARRHGRLPTTPQVAIWYWSP